METMQMILYLYEDEDEPSIHVKGKFMETNHRKQIWFFFIYLLLFKCIVSIIRNIRFKYNSEMNTFNCKESFFS